MTTKIQKWGNSLGVRIPKRLMQVSGLAQGAEVSIDFKNGIFVMEPKKQKEYTKPKYTIEELVKGMTKENMHELVDWGPDVGAEILPPWEN